MQIWSTFRVSKPTGCYQRLTEDRAGKRAVSQADAVLLVATADKVGLDSALSQALGPWRKQSAVLDPGQILLDLAISVAVGGDCLADIAFPRWEPAEGAHRKVDARRVPGVRVGRPDQGRRRACQTSDSPHPAGSARRRSVRADGVHRSGLIGGRV